MLNNRFLKLYLIAVLFFLPIFVTKAETITNTPPRCNFTRSLYLNTKGNDVKCLQDYLKNEGYFSYKYGSTGFYGSVTKNAVTVWQKYFNIEPVDGYFGPISKEKYLEIFSHKSIPTPTDEALPTGSDCSIIKSLQEIISKLIAYLNDKGIKINSPIVSTDTCKVPEEEGITPSHHSASGENTTTDDVVVDATAPIITNISATPSATTATVIWTTDEVADSQVEYGLTTSYGSTTTLDTTNVTSHSVGLSSLTENTIYHYRVISSDPSGNTTTSSDNTLTTTDAGAPALPTNLNVTDSSGEAIVTWTDPGDSDLASIKIYRGTVSGNLTLLTTVNAGDEGYVDSTVNDSTTYYYALSAVDSLNNESSQTTEASVAMPDITAPALPTNINVTDNDEEALITWADPTDLDLASIKIYRGTVSGSLTLLTTVIAGTETYTDTTVNYSTTYYYTLSSIDTSDNTSSQTTEVSMTTPAPPTYDENVLVDGPVLYWRLNDTTITDSSGNNYTGAMGNGIAVDTGLTGNGLDFNGTDSTTRIYRNSATLVNNITGSVTLEAIIRLDEAPENDVIIAKGKTSAASSDDTASPFDLHIQGNRLRFSIHGKVSGSSVSTNISYALPLEYGTNKYYHVVGTWDGTTGPDNMKLYLNGVLVSTGSQDSIPTLDHPSTPIWVGNDPIRVTDARFVFGGLIQDVAIYNKTLTSARIKSHSDIAFGNSTLTPGNPIFISKTHTTVSLGASAPTGGSAPYTYQWQKSEDDSNWSNVTGQTSLSITDEGLTPETTYYYRIVDTDSNNESVTSDSIEVTTYLYDLDAYRISTFGGEGTPQVDGSLRITSGKTFVSWAKDSGNFYVTEIDESTKVKTDYLIDNLSPNRHMTPSISELPDGRIVIIYDNHLLGRMRISTSVGTLSGGLDPIVEIPLSDMKYSQTVVTEEGSGTERIYVFYSKYSGNGRVGCYIYTDDRGATWSAETTFINKINDDWIYLTARKSEATGRILVGFTESNISSGTTNSSGYLIIYNPATGNWATADDTTLSIPYTPNATARFYDASTNDLEVSYTIYGYETLNKIYLVYPVVNQDTGERRIQRSVYDKSLNTWSQQEIINNDIETVHTNVVMNESDFNTVFILKKINDVWDVYKYTTTDEGLTWTDSGNETQGLMLAKDDIHIGPIIVEIKGGIDDKPRYVFGIWSYPTETTWDGVIYVSPYNQ